MRLVVYIVRTSMRHIVITILRLIMLKQVVNVSPPAEVPLLLLFYEYYTYVTILYIAITVRRESQTTLLETKSVVVTLSLFVI